ncbi:MAG TPA: PEP/pyruvate-binding domain-containing protein [Gemmatimonadales bacterium]|nr:PEP/pyruvate-binding domain-containing protein [Gemmatimonadales bacterium]
MPTLDDIAATDASLCGHKAATLALLRQAGLDVPAGFVIGVTQTANLDEAAIAEHLRALNGPVAVRSSGIAEDLPDASFAGQYDTILNVEGLDNVLSAVRQCMASAASQRVRAYGGGGALAVLVQSMVQPSAAGVAFSANPMTGDRDEVLVSATRGLGDRLVSGEVDGDAWSVRGGVATPTAAPEGCIDASIACRVAELAGNLEARLGAPQDIEWALVGQRLVLLQSRPVSVLPVAPIIEIPKGTWQKDTDHYAGPVTPFGTCIFKQYDVVLAGMIESWGLMPDAVQIRGIGHEVYSHVEPDDGGNAPPPWWLIGAVARVLPSLRRKLIAAERAVAEGRLTKTSASWEAEFKPELVQKIAHFARVSYGEMSEAELWTHWEALEELSVRALTIHFELFVTYTVGLHELVVVCRELLDYESHQVMPMLQGLSVASSAPTRGLAAIAKVARQRHRVETRAVIEQGGPEFFERLREIDPELSAQMDRYLERWGLRTIDYDAGTPTLAEDPGLVASLVEDLLDERPATRSLEESRRAAVATARAELKSASDLARFDAALAYAEQVYPQREDNVLYTVNLIAGLMRGFALEVGRRLTQQGRLVRAQDAVLLTVEQLRSALADRTVDPAAIAARVRSELAWVRANPGPSLYGPAPGAMPDLRGLPRAARRINGAISWAMEEELGSVVSSSEAGIRGLPSSPGVATGTVRVISSSKDIHRVRTGDVVVCPTTTPAWTVIFQRASAIVADGGSALCHAAIVAREHGIPAVVATGNGTKRLRDGQRVLVDGNSGTVSLVDD